MTVSAALFRILKSLSQSADSELDERSSGAADPLSAMLDEIAATVRPRTIVFSRGPEDRLVLQAAGGELLGASLMPPPEVAGDYRDRSEEFAAILIGFADRPGAFETLTGPLDQDAVGEGVSAKKLRAACAGNAEKPAPSERKKAARKAGAGDEKPAHKAAKPAARAIAKGGVPDSLQSTLKAIQPFVSEAIIVAPGTAEPEAPATYLGEIAGRLAEEALAWRDAAAGATGQAPFLLARPTGLEGHCLVILPEANHVLIAAARNRDLSHLTNVARQRGGGGGRA